MVLIKQKHQDIIEQKIYDELRTDIGDNIVIHQRGTTQNCPWCFIAGTSVFTDKGIYPIEKIFPKIKVLTKEGTFESVSKLLIQQYSGKLNKIKTILSPETISTPNHGFFTLKNEDGSIQKVEARNIKKGDYLLIPSFNTSSVPVYSDNKYVQKKYGPIVKQINSIFQDPDFPEIIGLYISEGGAYRRSVVFSINSNRTDIQEFIIRFFERNGFYVGGKNKNHRNCIQLSINSVALVQWFINNCGQGWQNKKIPYYLVNTKIIKSILLGIWHGDGHYCKTNDICIISTSSSQLAKQLRQIIVSLGYSRLSYSETESFVDKNGIFHNKSYHLSFGYSNNEHYTKKFINGNVFVYVISNEEINSENITLYNLEVENEHSYTANGLAVSNCKLDTMTNKSANIPADGKDWSTHPNYAGTDLVCPNCNGKYYIQSDVTTTIKVIVENKEELQLIDGKLGRVDLGRIILTGKLEDIEGNTNFNDNILLKAVKIVYDGLDYKIKKVKANKLLSAFGFEATIDRMDRLDLPSSNVLTS